MTDGPKRPGRRPGPPGRGGSRRQPPDGARGGPGGARGPGGTRGGARGARRDRPPDGPRFFPRGAGPGEPTGHRPGARPGPPGDRRRGTGFRAPDGPPLDDIPARGDEGPRGGGGQPFRRGARVDRDRPPGFSPRFRGPGASRDEPWAGRGPRHSAGSRGAPSGPRPFEARPSRTAPAPPLAEDEELVAGRRPVEEAFAAGRSARRLLVTPARRQALERIVLHATTLRIPIVEVEGGSLTALAGFDGHQGVAVVVEARRFASAEDILARSIERGEPAFVLVLDSLEDPHNVGSLLRTAEAAGVHGVVFPRERQAPLSPAAVKVSAGATEHLLLAPVDDLSSTLTDLHLRGIRVVGSDSEAALTAREADLRGPIALVVGSEGHGLSPAVRRRCDLFVRLPMRGSIGSLNAAVAGSILLYEVLGQRASAAEGAGAP